MGKKILDKINGCFAFAIYNKKLKKLFFARDRLGIKPFYYALVDNVFLFSSEVRAIIATEIVSNNISKRGLSQYLEFQSSCTNNNY